MPEVFQNAHALFVGVGTYIDEGVSPIEESVNDATDLKSIFTDPEKAGYSPDNVQLITNEKATKEGIINGFDKLIADTDENSTVVVYYSGHGTVTQSKETFLLVPHNYTSSNFDTWLMDTEFQQKISEVKAKKMIVMLDACHSAGMSKSKSIGGAAGIESVSKSIRSLATKLSEGSGRAIFSSCTDNELSWILGRNSIFTQSIMEALNGEHPHDEEDNVVNLLQMADYVFKQVPRKSTKAGEDSSEKQHPFVNRIENMADGFPICFLPVGKKGKDKGIQSSFANKSVDLLVQEREGLKSNVSMLIRKVTFMQNQQSILSDPAQQFQVQMQLLELTERQAGWKRKIDLLNELIG